METGKKIPGNRLLLGLLSAFRTLVMALSKNGALDQNEFVHVLQQTAEAHREFGDPNRLADAIVRVCRSKMLTRIEVSYSARARLDAMRHLRSP